jgi:hypothetical protein
VEDLPDAKGPIEVVGQLGLALLSPLVVKYIAQVIVEFVKRNPQYIVKINGIEISRDRVSEKEIEAINKFALDIMTVKQTAGRKR